MSRDMKGIVVTIDRVEGTNPMLAMERYRDVIAVLRTSFPGIRIRVGCTMATLESARSVMRTGCRA